jgi:hypothetical protein
MPPARRVEELLEHYGDSDFQERLVRCWALADLLGHCLLPDGWQIPQSLHEAVGLTAQGRDWATWGVENGIDWDIAKTVVFTTFARESLFVDVEKTDISAMLAAVSTELRDKRIRISTPFGREADDLFGSMFGEWRDELSVVETQRFLSQLPQGIAQYGNTVFGPLGVLMSAERRLFDVQRVGAGFYCDDAGCDMLHRVELTTGHSDATEALRVVTTELDRAGHRFSEWGPFVRRVLFPTSVWESDRFTAALPELVVNALSDSERAQLFGLLLRDSGTVRAALADNDETAAYSTRHADDIVTEMTSAESVQAILTESDGAVVRALESLVRQERIVVPTTEARVSPFSRSFIASGYLRVTPQLSALGVRFVSVRRRGVDQLRTFVRELYATAGSDEELEWNLRNVPGDSLAERLNHFLLSFEPSEIIRTLVFDSPARVRAALEIIGPGDYDVPTQNSNAEDRLVRAITWKLGLHVDAYPEYLLRFHDRRKRFARSVEPWEALPPEDDRDEIRGAGSNLFVALEEVLDASLAFSSWSLTFDHFGARRNRFEYTLADARHEGFRFINDHATVGASPQLDPDGSNTLEPLSAGFGHLAEILRGAEQEESIYRRPEAQLPQWSAASSLEVFPFRHTLPWLDLTKVSKDRIISALAAVPGMLSRNDVARVRNQTAHRRDDFPTGVEVRQVCDTLAHLVAGLEEAGLAPNVFTRQRLQADAYGRYVAVLADYYGREVELATPSEIRRSGVPPIGVAQVILRAAVIEGTSEPLRFSVVEESDFRRMWLGWPTVVQAPAIQPGSAAREGSGEGVADPDAATTTPTVGKDGAGVTASLGLSVR